MWSPNVVLNKQLSHRSLKGFDIAPVGDYLESRKPCLSTTIAKSFWQHSMESTEKYFIKCRCWWNPIYPWRSWRFKPCMATCLWIRRLPCQSRVVPFIKMEFSAKPNRLFIVESVSAVITPRRYRNEFGQLMEHSPFCERDIRKPQDLHTIDEKRRLFALHQKAGSDVSVPL